MERGKLFSDAEKKFINAGGEEVTALTERAWNELIRAMAGKFEDNVLFFALLTGAKMGVYGDETVGDEERALIDRLFGQVYTGPMEDVYADIERKIEESDYEFLQEICSLGNAVALPLLDIILGFAYIDGTFESKVAQRLEDTFQVNLMTAFFESGDTPEEPKP